MSEVRKQRDKRNKKEAVEIRRKNKLDKLLATKNKVYAQNDTFGDIVVLNVSFHAMSRRLTAIRYVFSNDKTLYYAYPNDKSRKFELTEDDIDSDIVWHATNSSAQANLKPNNVDDDDSEYEDENEEGDK